MINNTAKIKTPIKTNIIATCVAVINGARYLRHAAKTLAMFRTTPAIKT